MGGGGGEFEAAVAGRYRIVRELGHGATATVYLADDVRHDRQVAIKILRPDLTQTLAGERFLREIAIAAQLQHPHILPLLDSGSAAGSFYFVMPFADGETLRARLNRAGRLGVAETVRILADVADALVYAHGRGVIHRDIKPDNIMVSGRHAVVMDFGVAKALNAAAAADSRLTIGVAIGTPAYMAPEQATADPALDHRVDIYALGVLGYELLTGRPPFRGAVQDVLTAHLMLTPEPVTGDCPDLPAPLAELVMRCLAKNPNDRWQRAEDIVERLDPLVTPSGGMAPASMPGSTGAVRWRSRAAALVGLIGLAVVLSNLLTRRPPEPARPIRPEQLTFLGTPIEAAISPDGQFLAYVTRGTPERLFVRDLTGSAVLPLAEADRIVDLGWLATGTEVSYRQRDGDTWSVRSVQRFGGAPRVLLRAAGWLSPDGTRVALLRPSGTTVSFVSLANRDTVSAVRTDGFQWIAGAAWAPGSDRLALALSSPETGLAVIQPDGAERVILRDSVGIVAPVWDPGGAAIYYVRSRSGLDGDVMRIGVDPEGRSVGPAELVLPGLAVVSDPLRSPALATLSLSRSGELVYIRTQVSSNLARSSFPADGAAPTLASLTMGTAFYQAPTLSPDGRRLAVFKATTQGAVLGITGATGGRFDEVATAVEAGSVAWAPDGKRLAFTATWARGGLMVGILDLESGSLRRFGAGRVGHALDWLGAKVVVQGPGSRSLVLLDPATDRVVPFVTGDSTTLVFQPRASPAADRVAFMANRLPHSAGIWSHRVGDAEADWSLMQDGTGRPIRWSRDGTTLYAVEVGGDQFNRLVAVPTRGGTRRVVATFGEDVTVEDVSADGRTVIVNRLMKQSDVWLAVLPPAPR